uniref:AlNc14C8G1074 protein n=1 Tax=Albugo laibachii Nc14 TaxID=890382 RepID=F0W1Z5_9STRA|nr:AlNc14C8G1074 [Albugo laibachii Nc14]|eukprot:CCA15074.1 AlNc14C8G1074 [Albugo laibachii Nc14]
MPKTRIPIISAKYPVASANTSAILFSGVQIKKSHCISPYSIAFQSIKVYRNYHVDGNAHFLYRQAPSVPS